MYKIGLDLAENSVGIAILNKKNLKYDSLILSSKEKRELDEFERGLMVSNWIFNYIKPYFKDDHKTLIEDVFYGLNCEGFKQISRLHGAISYRYYITTKKRVKFMMAVSARKLAKISPTLPKACIQLHVIGKFKLSNVRKEIVKEVRTLYNNLEKLPKRCLKSWPEDKRNDVKNKKKLIKNKLNKLSKVIERETGINEHIADAIILTLALGDKNEKK